MKTVRLLVIIIIFLAASIGSLIFFGMRMTKNTLKKPLEREDIKNGATPTDSGFREPLLDENFLARTIPESVHAYRGKVVSVYENGLTIHVEKEESYVNEDTDMRISIDEETVITEFSFPRILEEGQTPYLERKPITLADIRAGSMVEVTSEENIRGKIDFLADEVKVIQIQ